MEWDTGAAHAVATEAGRKVLNHETGETLRYNKENLLNPFFTVE
jgi:3'(2'), 5'-bisphosphate nucleotidase